VRVWEPCQRLLHPTPANRTSPEPMDRGMISKEQCLQALSPENLALLRETTWGRQCQEFKSAPPSDASQEKEFQEFCDAILNEHKGFVH